MILRWLCGKLPSKIRGSPTRCSAGPRLLQIFPSHPVLILRVLLLPKGAPVSKCFRKACPLPSQRATSVKLPQAMKGFLLGCHTVASRGFEGVAAPVRNSYYLLLLAFVSNSFPLIPVAPRCFPFVLHQAVLLPVASHCFSLLVPSMKPTCF